MTTTAEIEQIQGIVLVDETVKYSIISTITSVGGDTGFDELELFLFQKSSDGPNDDEYVQLCSVGDRLEYDVYRDSVQLELEATGWVNLSPTDIGSAVVQQSPGSDTGVLLSYDNNARTIRVNPDDPDYTFQNPSYPTGTVGLSIGVTTSYIQQENAEAEVVVGGYYRKYQAVSRLDTIQEGAAQAAAERRRLQNLVDDWEALIDDEAGTETTTVSSATG
jgi:hypothetical protein